MNRILILLLIMIFFLAKCKNVNEVDREYSGQGQEFVVVDERNSIDTGIASNLDQWIKYISSCDTTSGNELCYTVEFLTGTWSDHDLGKDTLIVFSYYIPDEDYSGYKGTFYFDNNNVAILDNNNVGTKFYDEQILENISLNTFKSGLVFCNICFIQVFKLENGKLVKKNRFDR